MFLTNSGFFSLFVCFLAFSMKQIPLLLAGLDKMRFFQQVPGSGFIKV